MSTQLKYSTQDFLLLQRTDSYNAWIVARVHLGVMVVVVVAPKMVPNIAQLGWAWPGWDGLGRAWAGPGSENLGLIQNGLKFSKNGIPIISDNFR